MATTILMRMGENVKKIVTIIGARPQFVKAAAVSGLLRGRFREVLVDTGQHYDYGMAGVFFEELAIPKPDYELGAGSGTHGEQTGKMLAGIEPILTKEAPDAVLVYGDTNSTLAGALAAAKLRVPVFHIEAGLRSYNRAMPEEINRVLADHISALLFAPTTAAVDNLLLEGIKNGVFQVGDVMYDAVLRFMKLAEQSCRLGSFDVASGGYYLATIHRAENTDSFERLQSIVNGLADMRETVVLPVHPRTRKQLQAFGLYDRLAAATAVRLIEPVSYLEMLLLEKHAKGIITDSGGVQKEAYFAGVPCFTLRDETEWTETLEYGWNRLVNPLRESVAAAIAAFERPAGKPDVYGDGNSAGKIVETIDAWFGMRAAGRLPQMAGNAS